MDYFFRTERLDVGYGGAPVVRNIEVSVKKGQVLALIGPNGSGKSTVLKSIAKQIKTMGGVIYVDGKSIKNIGKKEMARQAAVVLTERPKPELMTCGDVVAAGRHPYTGMLGILSDADREKIRDALLAVGAFEIKDRNFNEVSDGQLQRIMLARAICQEPEIIVLDEPTSFLDIRYAVDILDILRDMAEKRGVTVILSLHELNYVKRVSDIVMCVKAGRVVRIGAPSDIFNEDIISDLYDLPGGYYGQLFGGL
jgi:iron complex transport system ATP-binding protein